MSGRHSPGYVAPEPRVGVGAAAAAGEPHPEGYAPGLAELGFVQRANVAPAPVELGFGESGFVELGLEPAPVEIAPAVPTPPAANDASADHASVGWSLAELGFAEPASRSSYERPAEPAFAAAAVPLGRVPDVDSIHGAMPAPLRLMM